MIAANFEDDAVPSTPEPLQDEIQRMVLRWLTMLRKDPCELELRLSPHGPVYGALGPDHRRKPYVLRSAR